ncbi:glycolipid 2-alpha-mannosyltransferase-domain-containing protein [Fennellomyces sp. T-0311]|nr:glycolipid 2-alpha-mannosyltransferase-domain-containing protein [Fennellomyces sp. T-0311]
MISLSHRSPCYLLQIFFLAYIFASIWYVFCRPTLPWRFSKDSTTTSGGISYTTGPRNNPNQLTVQLPAPGNHTQRVNAGFVVLVRNSELRGMLDSMYDVEERFNKKFGYPWLFLNNEPFTEEFKTKTSAMTVGKTHYAFVDPSMWSYPEWINQTKAAERREELKGVPYGLSESYRHMCRFQSGFFWRHPKLLELGWEYYWRVEPNVRYFCELDYDPFLYMKQNNKKYAFTISFVEHGGTIQTLWPHVKHFVKMSLDAGKNYFSVPAKDSLYRFITDEEGKNYNQCHFWTNFEIARVDLWQSEAYQKLFQYLDMSGGFFYERWGDAPVHSIFAAMYLRKDEVHYFHDIGYKHSIYQHCPESESLADRCYCDPAKTLDYTDRMSCLTRYMEALESRGSDMRTVGEILRP